MVRARALDSLSTEYAGRPLYAARNQVLDIPRGFFRAQKGLVEKVSADTALFTPQTQWQ